jgi:hypothetical protein
MKPRPNVAFAIALFSFCSATAAAQSVEAVRLTSTPRLDGRLDEEVWRTAPAMTGFTQREPNEGIPAIEPTEIRFAYDGTALWIGARMFSSRPQEIRALVTRRDRETTADQMSISFDTHRDRRTAYTFSVNAAGVRSDWYHSSDFETSRSFDFNPVWEAATAVDSAGWTAEIRIPFSQLRFRPGDVQEWGVNAVRSVPSRNESDYWVLVRRNETGWSSRMGALTGISGINSSRRVELLPYVATDSRFLHRPDPNDPFAEDYATGFRTGADVKMGVGPNLTLDLAINPDFAQVEADPAQVNLTAYETFFPERRPFFLEGAQLFGGRGFYYSRRIGAPPPGFAPGAEYVELIENTTILGAAKLTGRLPSGLSVGALAAVTDRETARTYDVDSDTFGEAELAPRSLYSVASAQQEFGRTRSTVGGMLSMVKRDVESGTPLADLLVRSAYSGMFDTRIRWAGGKYDVSTYLGFTRIEGDSVAILRQQLSSRRYWQRPDAAHVEVDPSLRRMNGTTFGINHSKLSGAHWLWDIDYWQEMPGLEPNDMGSFNDVDDRGLAGGIRYRETRPRSWYRSYTIGAIHEVGWNFDGDRTGQTDVVWSESTLRNFWRLYGEIWEMPRSQSDALTRGGPLMQTARARGGTMELRNAASARTGWSGLFSLWRDEEGGHSLRTSLGFSFRPGSQWEVRLDPRWRRWEDSRQFVTATSGGRPETFNTRYIFAHVDRDEVAAQIRLNYTFTPDFSLETYVEPFASSGRYRRFGELLAPRERALLEYGGAGTTITRNEDGSHTVTTPAETFTLANRDFNVRSFRSNMVFRWEWRLGSTVYLVWQQNRFAERELEAVGPIDLLDAFRPPGDNFLALKVSYWIPLR